MLKTIKYLLSEVHRIDTCIKYAENAIKDHQKGIFSKSKHASELREKKTSLLEAVEILQDEFSKRAAVGDTTDE